MTSVQKWRRLALTTHIAASVGWLGAIVAFLGIAIAALLARDEPRIRALGESMQIVGWSVIVPFSIASLLSGLLQSWLTPWGFFRHYWVVAKLLITVVASGLLLLHMRVVDTIALAAASGAVDGHHLQAPKMQVVADAGAAVLVLLIAIGLSVYKPAGATGDRAPRWVRISAACLAIGLLVVVLRHVAGGSMQSH
ncbi:MAG TPA: hypothetical protein VEA16_23450 [Vicinamibacterales bacterium]|nr:hypothetical protein [Vicinamibacterales bacterium]